MERTIFQWNATLMDWSRGHLLVTDQRVVVGDASWRIKDLSGAHLVRTPHESRRLPLDWRLAPASAPGCWLAGGGTVGTAVLLAIDTTAGLPHPLLRLLAVGLGLAAVGGTIVALTKSAPTWEVYQLVLEEKGTREYLVPALWWYPDDQQAAERAVAAVQQAIASRGILSAS